MKYMLLLQKAVSNSKLQCWDCRQGIKALVTNIIPVSTHNLPGTDKSWLLPEEDSLDNQTYVGKGPVPCIIKGGMKDNLVFYILKGCFLLSKVLEGTTC